MSVYYELKAQAGSRRLLCISGTGGDLRQQPRLSDGPLGAPFDVLAYDQRGLGQTSVPAGPYTMADYADDADALLDGHSAGIPAPSSASPSAAWWPRSSRSATPDRVERLALCCTSSGGRGRRLLPAPRPGRPRPGRAAGHATSS